MKRLIRSNSDFDFFKEKHLINSNTANLHKLQEKFNLNNTSIKCKKFDNTEHRTNKFYTPKLKKSSRLNLLSKNEKEKTSKYMSHSPLKNVVLPKGVKPYKFLSTTFGLYHMIKKKFLNAIKQFKVDANSNFEILDYYIKKLLQKNSIEEGSSSLVYIQSFIISLNNDDFTNNCLCLELKSGLFKEFKKSINELSIISYDNNSDTKIINLYLNQIFFFIIRNFSEMIEIYNIFLNSLMASIKIYLIYFLNEVSLNDNDYFIYFKIYSMYYKLMDIYWKEWNYHYEENEYKSAFSIRLKSRAYYFFNNFNLAFLSYFDENNINKEKYLNKSSFKLPFFNNTNKKMKKKENCFIYTDYMRINDMHKLSFVISELYMFLNSKLQKWKRTIIQEDEVMKCRICEKDFSLNMLIIHSNRCKINHHYSKQILLINNEIKDIVSDPKFFLADNMKLFENELEINDLNIEDISNSPKRVNIKSEPLSVTSFISTLKKICLSISNLDLSDNDNVTQNEFFRMQKYIYRCFSIENILIDKKKKFLQNLEKNLKIYNYTNSIMVLINSMLCLLIKKKQVYENYLYLIINFDESTINLDHSINIREISSKYSKRSSFSDFNNSIKNIIRSSLEIGRNKKNLTNTFAKRMSLSNFSSFDKQSSSSLRNSTEVGSGSEEIRDMITNTVVRQFNYSYNRQSRKSKFFVDENFVKNPEPENDDIVCFDEITEKKQGIFEIVLQGGNISESNKEVENSESFSSDDSDQDLSANISKLNTIFRKQSIFIEEKEQQSTLSFSDFEIIEAINQGGFGRVYLVKKKSTDDYFALKKIYKSYIKKKNLFNLVENEKTILNNINNDFVVKCYYSFSDQDYIYFVMEYLNGGDLSNILRLKYRITEEDWVRQYAAEIILALEYLHSNDITHRDLKPENIMIDQNGHIKLADFGLSEISDDSESYEGNNSGKVLGSVHYLAPELILKKPHGKEVDYWALGIIIFELLTGETPFNQGSPSDILECIINDEIEFPKVASKNNLLKKEYENQVVISEEAYILLKGLLVKNPKERLGSKGVEEIKNLDFFRNIDFNTVMKQKPIYIPKAMSRDKVLNTYFDKSRINDLAFKPLIELSIENQKDNNFYIENYFNEAEDYSIIREDLLHKKNLDCIKARMKKIKSSYIIDKICDQEYNMSEMN